MPAKDRSESRIAVFIGGIIAACLFSVCLLPEIAYNMAVSWKVNGVMGIERKGQNPSGN